MEVAQHEQAGALLAERAPVEPASDEEVVHEMHGDLLRFVVLVRDGRAVAESLSRVDWWETNHVWWYGGTPTNPYHLLIGK